MHAAVFERHQNVAFQFSGGRDSTAALFHMRPYWDRMEVYHLDTDDQFPETRAVVALVRGMLPQPLHIIKSSSPKVRAAHGLPSDLVPVDNTPIGSTLSGKAIRIQGRDDCCIRSIMQPMHDRMLADGITLIVRGQRNQEFKGAPPARSGATGGGMEVLFPIEDWTAEQVDVYLMANQLPVAPFYSAGMKGAPECMGCTAWWGEGRRQYMQSNHPKVWLSTLNDMDIVRTAVLSQLRAFPTHTE